MNAIGSAIYTALAGDATLTSLGCTAVYHELAPPDAEYPFLVHQAVAETDHYTFGERAWEEHVWMVRAWDQGRSTVRAQALMDRVDEVLTDQALTLPGGARQLVCRRTERIPVPAEIDDQTGEHLRGAGARFVIGVAT